MHWVVFEMKLKSAGIVVADTLPAGVTFLDAVPEGVYNVATGLWTIGSLAFGDTVQLTLTVTVYERTGGEVISNTAHVQVLAQVDPEHGNDTATAAVTVEIPGIGRVLASVVVFGSGWSSLMLIVTISIVRFRSA